MTHWSRKLKALVACSEAIEWANTQQSFAVAWEQCNRGDWMIWLAAKKIGKPGWPSHRQIVLAACACATTALKHIPKGENRPRKAIATARKWAIGKATLKEVRIAANSATEAADDAEAADSANAANAAANAADAADAANAAANAADAANAANAAANAADAADAALGPLIRKWLKVPEEL